MSLAGQKIWAFIKAQGAFFARLFLDDPLYPKIKNFFTAPRWHKARLGLGISVAVGVLAVLIVPQTCWALELANACGAVAIALARTLAIILKLTGEGFNYVIGANPDPGNPFQYIIGTQAVKIGWTAVRDVCNLGFVLILLGIGFATILRVPAYHVKKLILPFIVALLLINFSKLICGVITDFCHVIMASFAAAMTGGSNYSGSIANAIGVGNWINPTDATNTDKYINNQWEMVEAIAIMCVFMMALIFAFLLLIVLLVVRWVTLIVLTIFSPIAYAARILPTTKDMAGKWWKQFLQNAFYGPVAVFMVYLALVIVTYSMGALATNSSQAQAAVSVSISKESFLSLIVACILLYKAVTMSRSMGIAGANAAIKSVTKGVKGVMGAAAAPVTDRLKAAWGARKSAIQAARKESGERLGTSAAVRGTIIGGRARAKSRQAQEAYRTGQEKRTSEEMRPGDQSDEDLKKKLQSGSKQEQLAAGTELAKRGKLERKDYKKLSTMGGLSASGQAGLKDAMKASDPMGVIDTAKAGWQEELHNTIKHADLKKLSPEALTKNSGSAELVEAIAHVRGKDGLTSIHKEMTSEADKTAFGRKLEEITKKGFTDPTGTDQKGKDIYEHIAGASVAVNRVLPVGADKAQLAAVAKKADPKDLGIAMGKPGAISSLSPEHQEALGLALSASKMAHMAEYMDATSTADMVRMKYDAHVKGGTAQDDAQIKAMRKNIAIGSFVPVPLVPPPPPPRPRRPRQQPPATPTVPPPPPAPSPILNQFGRPANIP